jgi:hypothetical protein
MTVTKKNEVFGDDTDFAEESIVSIIKATKASYEQH